MSANLQTYEQSVLQFLQSCTIKFSPIADRQNYNIQMAGGTVDLNTPESFKYYLNLSGQYHSTDTVMSIISLDTKTTVNFTTAMLATSPRTKAAYTVGSSYYTALCTSYPSQVDLIKSIIYPVSLDDAIAADDFTLLGWGDGYLEEAEQDAIIYELIQFINFVSTKWYGRFVAYEPYYTWAFWGLFWQSLPNAVFSARLKYLHTACANSFHIWSYLQSNGIGDYSDVLTQSQALFLYRNIRYLEENRGKQSNLILLVNRLLDTLNVGLVGKTIFMNTATQADIAAWTPEFVSTIIPTNNSQSLTIVAPETMSEINANMISSGLEYDSSASHIAQQQTKIQRTVLNILPTKIVEIQKFGVDQKYGGVLITFILDTLVSMIVTNRYVPSVDIIDPTTNTSISLSGKDALALYYYSVHRVSRNTVVNLPVVYSPSAAFQYGITTASFPDNFIYKGNSYPTRSYLDIEEMVSGVSYPQVEITDPAVFSDLVADLFVVLIRYIRYSRIEANAVSLNMFLNYCENYALQSNPYTFSLSSSTTYAEWAAGLNLTGLLSTLDGLSTYTDAYASLSTAIATALVPENSPVYTQYGYTSQDTINLYDRMKSLFVQLSSYNIAFLDTDRENIWWFLTKRIVYDIPLIESDELLGNITTGSPGILYAQDNIPLDYPIPDHDFVVSPFDTVPVKITESGDTISITQSGTIMEQLPNSIVDSIDVQTGSVSIAFPQMLKSFVVSTTTTGV